MNILTWIQQLIYKIRIKKHEKELDSYLSNIGKRKEIFIHSLPDNPLLIDITFLPGKIIQIYNSDLARYNEDLNGLRHQIFMVLTNNGFSARKISYEDSEKHSSNVIAIQTIVSFEEGTYLVRAIAVYKKNHGKWCLGNKLYNSYPMQNIGISFCGEFGEVNYLGEFQCSTSSFYLLLPQI